MRGSEWGYFLTNWYADKGLHPHTVGRVNMARDDGVEICFRAAPSYWKPAAQVRDQAGQEHCSVTVMTAATCKTQAEQTTGINHPADATASTYALTLGDGTVGLLKARGRCRTLTRALPRACYPFSFVNY